MERFCRSLNLLPAGCVLQRGQGTFGAVARCISQQNQRSSPNSGGLPNGSLETGAALRKGHRCNGLRRQAEIRFHPEKTTPGAENGHLGPQTVEIQCPIAYLVLPVE